MSEQMRKEFEEWAKEDGIDLELVVTPHGSYYADEEARAAWDGWQASRQALVVELPSSIELYNSPSNEVLEAVQDALDKAGVSYK
jgi:hypothetical protein